MDADNIISAQQVLGANQPVGVTLVSKGPDGRLSLMGNGEPVLAVMTQQSGWQEVYIGDWIVTSVEKVQP